MINLIKIEYLRELIEEIEDSAADIEATLEDANYYDCLEGVCELLKIKAANIPFDSKEEVIELMVEKEAEISDYQK